MKDNRVISSFVIRRLSFVVRHSIFCGSFLAILFLAILGGCLPSPDTDRAFTTPLADLEQNTGYTARLSSFLTLKDDQGPPIRLEVAKIEVFADDISLQINNGPLIIDSTAIGSGQLFLGGVPVPPGRYHRMRLTVTKGEILKADGKYSVIAPEPFHVEMNLAVGLNLESDDSGTLLITWDLQNSLQTDNTLTPDLIAFPSLRQIPLDLVFVSCPDIDTIFVVSAYKNWVVDSFGLKGGPTYLAIDPDNPQILYVLASRDRIIKVVELSTYRVVNFFPVPLNDEPTFMVINPDGRSAFLLDERSGYLSRINLTTGTSVARVLLDNRPTFAAYLEEQNLLAVSLSLSQKVLLLNPESLKVMRTISTGNAPQGLTVSDNQLLIAEYGENTVSIVDLANRGNQNRLTVGFGPRRLLETNDQIYVSNYLDGSLSVLMTGQLGVIQDIYGLGLPLEMEANQSYFRLYVADVKRGALTIIDTNSNRLIGNIFLGARPFDLEVTQ